MSEINFGAAESIYGMIPMLVYIFYAIVRDAKKNKRVKSSATLNEVLKILEDHEKKDAEKYAMISRDLHAQKVLISILLTPHNCSTARFAQLENEYMSAKAKGVNGIVAHAFIEFCEKREKKLKQAG